VTSAANADWLNSHTCSTVFFVALNSGKRIERSERGQPGEFADLENMTAGELAEFIRKQAEMYHAA
jgi:hypothetical protein